MADPTKTTGPVGTQLQIKEGVALKDSFNRDSYRIGASAVKAVYAAFPVEDFLDTTIDGTWEGLELKARWRKATLGLGEHLPESYRDALAIIDLVVASDPMGASVLGFSFPDFVEVFGCDDAHWDASVSALERYTAYWSAEFAVRPFIIRNEERMMAQMLAWAEHGSEHVRRLASEGCRPQLPWAQSLPSFKKDPTPIIPLLEKLKADPSAYVRKSVANNLNDISKTHPKLVVGLAQDWYGIDDRTDWIVKHGCRTLLKKGDRDALSIFGYGDAAAIDVSDFTLDASSATIGDHVTFSFTISSSIETKVRLEYGIDFVKSKGKRNRKVFQISETTLGKGESRQYRKSHSFADLSTRKHYPGNHTITLIVNGTERASADIEVG